MNVHYYSKQTKRYTRLMNIKRKSITVAKYLTALVALAIVYLFIVVVTV